MMGIRSDKRPIVCFVVGTKRPRGIGIVRLLTMFFVFTVAISKPAAGDDVPFATPPSSRLGSASEAYYASLSDIMSVIQLRHIKLWQAGTSGDWRMTSFEIEKIRETFRKAALFYSNIPVPYVVAVARPLDAMRQAALTGDRSGFVRSYGDLTTACNQCHKAAQLGFIVIKTPTSSPFTDQKF